jgi:GTP-binding protein EngB required for normal cell division
LEISKGENKTIEFKECLLVKVENITDPEVDLIISNMDRLREVHYMPLVLLMAVNYAENSQLKYDSKIYTRIDPRLIRLTKYEENNQEKIESYLLRFCSIHNELGDQFTIGKGDKEEESYDLIERYFPFNINIACIGSFGKGKSTGVNVILNEYKAKESSKGSAQTKHLTFYQVSNQPIRILDIPGFEDVETVKRAVDKLKLCGEKINKIKDNLHCILYFLNYLDDRTFQQLEKPILEELCNLTSSKIIYVITHSNPQMNDADKGEKISKINEGIQKVLKDTKFFEQTKKGGMLEANEDNTVFVNFHKDKKANFEKFGIGDLFKKIHDFFIKSEDYKKFNKRSIDEQAAKLRAQAERVLIVNKIGGAFVGIIPLVDWALQRFVIKKNAAKKVGQIYGIDIKYVNEAKKDEKDKKEEKKNINKEKPEYISKNVDLEHLDLEIEEETLLNESTEYKVGNSIKVGGETASMIGGGVSLGTGLTRTLVCATEGASTTVNLATGIGKGALLGSEGALLGAEGASTGVRVGAGVGSTVFRVLGYAFIGLGAVLGVALGGYFTHKHCCQIIDKFEEYYKKNAAKILNSYELAELYLSNQSNINN